MSQGSAFSAMASKWREVRASSIPLLPRAAELMREGFVTGASGRNWDSYWNDVTLPADYPLWQRASLKIQYSDFDPRLLDLMRRGSWARWQKDRERW
jgi:hypothetical protein